MEAYKYLIKNMGLLTLSNFATKLLSIFLVPLYTNALSTSDYGTYDLFHTTISLLIPVLTIDIQQAVLRFSMDANADHDKIWYVGCRYTIVNCLIVCAGVVFNKVTGLVPALQQYAFEFLILYIFESFSAVILSLVRGSGKIADLSIAGVISSIVMISCNIFFLLVFKMGLYGYFWASILGTAAQVIYLLIRSKIFKSLKYYKDDVTLRKEMVTYSKPMVANSISWWVNNASDRYIVASICGLAANGIYSVSYKIPSILSILYSIFSQAWTLSATKEFDKEDRHGFFLNTYNIYNCLLVVICSLLMFMDKPLAKMLLAKEFYLAWKYVPLLTMSTVFSGMSAFLGAILSALKKSDLFAQSSIFTAVVNTALNVLLVLYIGPLGAAISTAFAYFLMWLIRLRQVKRYIKLRVNVVRDLSAYLVLVIQSLMLLVVTEDTLFCWYQLGFAFLVFLLYTKELKLVFAKILASIR